jgi:4-hydroxy-tetrahydrodipicolinate synthase
VAERNDRPYRAVVCTVTPFDEAGRLDEAGIEQLMDRIAGAGVGVAIGTASPGEGFSLSLDETARFYEITKRVVAGRVPICAMGVEPRTAEQLRPIIRLAEEAGLDLMQLYTIDPGHAMRLTDGELERFFCSLLDDMSIDAAISTHAYNGLVPLSVLARLVDRYPNISTIHCTSEVNYLTQVLAIVDGRCEVLVGGPMQALSALALGGQGFLCSEGNLAPLLCGQIQRAVRAGDLEGAGPLYRQLIAVFTLNGWPGGTVRFLKTAMRILGLSGGNPRPPFELLGEEAAAALAGTMKELALPEWERP